MPTATTDFTRDVLGRYVCNEFDEAINSHNVRPFDTIIIGGGAFGSIVAQHLLSSDQQHRHRILVLEAGPFVLPEHVQNLPMLGLDVPPPVTSDPGLRNEVWGLPWLPNVAGGSPGLAYCIGGRSLFWGGWSPQPLGAELPSPPWPKTVVDDLTGSYFPEAAEQLATTIPNHFIYGDLQNALREQLFKGIGKVDDAIALDRLPDHPITPNGLGRSDLLDALGLPTNNAFSDQDLRNMLKLEAPLAVQGHAPHPGFFALNKFSPVPLLIEATRTAWNEAPNDDTHKRLMVVPLCHAKRLLTTLEGSSRHVSGIETNRGTIPIPTDGRIVLALGTIENTRLALESFAGLGLPHYELIGSGLQVHLRSNLTIRIPRTALTSLPASAQELQAGALFLKGQHTINGAMRHFHLQITASGLSKLDTVDAEAKLFKLIPDIDTMDSFRSVEDDIVVIAIRGVAEMEANNAESNITLSPTPDEFGVKRAIVTIVPTAHDNAMWNALDTAIRQVAEVFAGKPVEIVPLRDGLGTTYHEASTLRMGDDPNIAITNAAARFHAVENVYVTGPALFPTSGSTNPALTGVALARRLAAHLK